MDFTKTTTLLKAVEQLTPPSSFLKDRYFPTDPNKDIFATSKVLIEYKNGTKKLAPFVSPRRGGVTIEREGYNMTEFSPANIMPATTLTLDDLDTIGFGEALFSKATPEQRQNIFMLRDAKDLSELITRREEAMAADVMLNNKCVMKEVSDRADKPEEKEIRFYDEEENPATYTPSVSWARPEAHIISDIKAMIRALSSKGLAAKDLVCSPDVADAIIANKEIKELLDIRNYHVGEVKGLELSNSAAIVAELVIAGKLINVISYEETYTNDKGVDTLYIPSGYCVLTAPNAGRTLYGAVSQVESDKQFHTYLGTRVPKYSANDDDNVRKLTLTAKPLPMPVKKNAFLSAKVITE